MNPAPGLWNVIRREVKRLGSRPIYLVGMVLVPVVMSFFFVSIMKEGLPLRVPAAVVNLDGSQMSRQVIRSLNAIELVDITEQPTSFNEAMSAVQRGEIFGFFVIPRNFSRDAVAGRSTTLTFYSNLTYYVPGSLVFKGFKTLAVTTSGGLVQTKLVSVGTPEAMAANLIQPMNLAIHPINNPYLNYSYYLSTSFIPGVLELMIFLMTAFGISHEFKEGSSVRWLATANNRIGTALIGKLAPQTLIFTIMGFGMNSLMFDWLHFPLNCPIWHLLLGMFLFVVACQSFAVIVCSLLPAPRYSLTICSLCGILAFSLAAFSFPVASMYGSLAIFSYILPVRYYFMIYCGQALNGIPLYYSRLWYAGLLVFPIIATLIAPLMRRMALKPVYVR